jgi:hypothetical protein
MLWLRLGIRHERIEPGKPQQNGRHERMHQTLKQETANPPERNLRRQQMAFLHFQQEYNQERPHEALNYATPASRYAGSERRYPAKLPELEYPEGAHLRRVSHHGDVKLDGVQMFVSSLLAWEVVGLVELDQNPDWLEVYYGPLLIGWIDLKKRTLVPIGTGRRGPRIKRVKRSLRWGRCPQTPGIFRFPARIPGSQERAALALAESRPLNRRSGSIPREPYPPFRWIQFINGDLYGEAPAFRPRSGSLHHHAVW